MATGAPWRAGNFSSQFSVGTLSALSTISTGASRRCADIPVVVGDSRYRLTAATLCVRRVVKLAECSLNYTCQYEMRRCVFSLRAHRIRATSKGRNGMGKDQMGHDCGGSEGRVGRRGDP